MTDEQRIKADLDHFFRTGEIPEPWAAIAPEPVDEPECRGHESTDGPIGNTVYCDGTCRRHVSDAEFDRRIDEINRELDAIESGSVEPPRFGWLNRIGRAQ